MIPGRSYSGPYMIPGRSYSGPYMIPGRSWQDNSKEICMICMCHKLSDYDRPGRETRATKLSTRLNQKPAGLLVDKRENLSCSP